MFQNKELIHKLRTRYMIDEDMEEQCLREHNKYCQITLLFNFLSAQNAYGTVRKLIEVVRIIDKELAQAIIRYRNSGDYDGGRYGNNGEGDGGRYGNNGRDVNEGYRNDGRNAGRNVNYGSHKSVDIVPNSEDTEQFTTLANPNETEPLKTLVNPSYTGPLKTLDNPSDTEPL